MYYQRFQNSGYYFIMSYRIPKFYTCCMEQYVLYKSICSTRDKKNQAKKQKQRI